MRMLISLTAAAFVLAACTNSQPAAQTSAPATSSPQASAAAMEPAAKPKLLAGQPSYPTTDDAVAALYKAASSKDLRAMANVLGLPVEDVQTGDAAKDAEHANRFATAYDEFHRTVVDPNDASRARVFIGKDNYPVASPLVHMDGAWFFDSAGGKQELVAGVIGENELNTIGVCRAYVQAQYEYYSEDRNGDDVLQYAQHLASTKGMHDGLYWHTDPEQPESPLGLLIAEAKAAGYIRGSARSLDEPKPYHGYLFQILTSQGTHAAGGKYDYIINGRMIAGFALVAYPAKYGKSGVMTFEVGANGKVYQKDLGKDAPAGAISEYDPDGSWTLVTE
jgi:hypothetical protein